MQTINLSLVDRELITGLTAAIKKLCDLQERPTGRALSNKEFAERIGRSEQTVCRYVKQGKVVRSVINGVYGIPESEIGKFIP